MTETSDHTIGSIEAIDDLVNKYRAPEVIGLSAPNATAGTQADVLILPDGLKAHSIKAYLDEYRDKPERRTGKALFIELASFLAHVNRFQDADSAIFLDPTPAAPSVMAVLDYHRAGATSDPRFGVHRSLYTPVLSDEWKAWSKTNGEKLGQQEFAEFLEDRIGDVRMPDLLNPGSTDPETEAQRTTRELASLLQGTYASPQKLMELAAGMKVTVIEHTAQAVTLSNGVATIMFQAEHKSDDGQKLVVPSLFEIGIPVFRGGPLYRVTVRLRYRMARGVVAWFYQMYQTDKVIDHVLADLATTVADDTALPVFVGKPES